MPITKRDIEKLEVKAQLWDTGRGAVIGFGARRQGEFPVFIVKYRASGRQRMFTIGKFGSPWTVDTARNEAKRLLGLVAAGQDPATLKAAAKASVTELTISGLCDRYMELARKGQILTRFNLPKKASTIAIDEGRISRHIKPLIGKIKVKDLDPKAVRKMIQDITAGKTAADEKTTVRGRAIVTGGAGTASRVADLLSGIVAWAVDEEYLDSNPVHGVRRYRGEPKQRHLNKYELQNLGKVLLAPTSQHHPFATRIITLLALTGCRLGEIAGLKWTEFDPNDKCLRLDDSKTGRSMRAIGSKAIEIIMQQPQQVGSPYVFPATRGDSFYQGTKRRATAIFKAASLEEVSSHTLRHTFGSVASDIGYSDATIAGLLGHKGRTVTSRYVHRPDEALASAAEAISNQIWTALTVAAKPLHDQAPKS